MKSMKQLFSLRQSLPILGVFLLVVFVTSGCGVYFNTFFNANKSFKQAENTRKANPTGGGGESDYKLAIEKCQKIVENFPKSAYYDDALFILGVSYYRTKQFLRAERRFRDLEEQFPDGKYSKRIPLFLAQTKRELNEIDSAIALFREVATTSTDRVERAEAALELGRYYVKENNPVEARPFLLAVRDSVGDKQQRETAQAMLADGYLASFEPQLALDAFLDLAKTTKDPKGVFKAKSQAVEAAYRMRQTELGQQILDELIALQENADTISSLQLKKAEGYEIAEETMQAAALYRQLAKGENKVAGAEACYQLGLIYQFELDDLVQARIYYDEAIKLARNSPAGNLATQRVSDITKLQQFTKQVVLDSTATQLKIDAAAKNAYDLAELYWFQLNEPDSAINELSWIIDSLPTSALVGKAMLTRAGMVQEFYGDSGQVDSMLRELINRYPASPSAEQARISLGLSLKTEDTTLPRYYVQRAEDFYLDRREIDSARFYYQQVIERFPTSTEAETAEFALIWLTDQYNAPGDSSLVYAYQEYLDSFPGTTQANWVRSQLEGSEGRRRRPSEEESGNNEGEPSEEDEAELRRRGDSAAYADRFKTQDQLDGIPKTTTDLELSLYVSIDGDTMIDLPFPPEEFKREFEFPIDAYVEGVTEYNLVFHLLLDFSGRVIKDSLRIPSNVDELNRRAEEAIETATFNSTKVATEVQRGNVSPSKADQSSYWFVYRWKIPVLRK